MDPVTARPLTNSEQVLLDYLFTIESLVEGEIISRHGSPVTEEDPARRMIALRGLVKPGQEHTVRANRFLPIAQIQVFLAERRRLRDMLRVPIHVFEVHRPFLRRTSPRQVLRAKKILANALRPLELSVAASARLCQAAGLLTHPPAEVITAYFGNATLRNQFGVRPYTAMRGIRSPSLDFLLGGSFLVLIGWGLLQTIGSTGACDAS